MRVKSVHDLLSITFIYFLIRWLKTGMRRATSYLLYLCLARLLSVFCSVFCFVCVQPYFDSARTSGRSFSQMFSILVKKEVKTWYLASKAFFELAVDCWSSWFSVQCPRPRSPTVSVAFISVWRGVTEPKVFRITRFESCRGSKRPGGGPAPHGFYEHFCCLS